MAAGNTAVSKSLNIVPLEMERAFVLASSVFNLPPLNPDEMVVTRKKSINIMNKILDDIMQEIK